MNKIIYRSVKRPVISHTKTFAVSTVVITYVNKQPISAASTTEKLELGEWLFYGAVFFKERRICVRFGLLLCHSNVKNVSANEGVEAELGTPYVTLVQKLLEKHIDILVGENYCTNPRNV